jgi:hypothetical protein
MSATAILGLLVHKSFGCEPLAAKYRQRYRDYLSFFLGGGGGIALAPKSRQGPGLSAVNQKH